jgi:hypothetical protein
VVGQGFPGGFSWEGAELVPENRQGLVHVPGRGEAFWSRSGPGVIWERDSQGTPVAGRGWEDQQLSLFWNVGSTYSWSISTDVLSLEELIAIAASVSFD